MILVAFCFGTIKILRDIKILTALHTTSFLNGCLMST